MSNLENDTRDIIPMRIIEEVGNEDKVITYYNIIHKNGYYWWEYDDIIYGRWNNISDAIQSAVTSLSEDTEE